MDVLLSILFSKKPRMRVPALKHTHCKCNRVLCMSKSDVHDFSSCLELILAAGAVPHLQESLLSLISPRTISCFWVLVRCLESSDLQVTSLLQNP
jgi:hypothetical protein